MDRRDAKSAYAILKPLEAERSGDPDFDYLLGIAALDSGRATEAVFALERVLAVNPAHPQARAEIARAYFVLGETTAAKREFESVKSQQPPAEVQATIERFLDAINRLADTQQTSVAAYIEGTLGYDTNVNSGPGSSQVAIPAFGGAVATLNASGVKTADYFGSATAGVALRHPLSKDVALLAGLNLNKRVHQSEPEFNTGYWDANLGVAWTRGADVFTAALQGNEFFLDGHRYREAYGILGQWQRNIDARNQVSAFGQYSQLRYADRADVQNSVRDANRSVAGVAYAHAFAGGTPVVFASLYLGSEAERDSTRPDLGHRLYGVRVGGQYSLNEKTFAFINGNAERRKYGGPDAAFLTTRKDTQYNYAGGVTYSPAKGWKITPQVSRTRNRSNIVINDFSRNIYSVTVRRDF